MGDNNRFWMGGQQPQQEFDVDAKKTELSSLLGGLTNGVNPELDAPKIEEAKKICKQAATLLKTHDQLDVINNHLITLEETACEKGKINDRDSIWSIIDYYADQVAQKLNQVRLR